MTSEPDESGMTQSHSRTGRNQDGCARTKPRDELDSRVFEECAGLLSSIAEQLLIANRDPMAATRLAYILKVVQSLEAAIAEIRSNRALATSQTTRMLVEVLDLLIETLEASLGGDACLIDIRKGAVADLKRFVERAWCAGGTINQLVTDGRRYDNALLEPELDEIDFAE